ncbi:MAG: ABC transporter ATP-binding protein [Acholeplasmataceae bacterium]|jgi:ATP-binding cassette subfamily B multidrug efflux pump
MRDYDDLDIVRTTSDKHLFKNLMKYLRPNIGKFMLGILLMFITLAVDLLPNFFMGKTIDIIVDEVLAKDVKMNFILGFIGIMVLILIIGVTLNYFQTIIMEKLGQTIVLDIRKDSFEKVQSLSANQHNKVPVGKFVTRITNDTAALSEMFSDILINLLRSSLFLVFSLVILFIYNWRLTLIILGIIPFVVLSMFTFKHLSRKAYRRTKTNVGIVNAFLSENLSGMKVTQIFNQEEKKKEEFNYHSKELRKSYLKEVLIFGVFRPMIFVFSTLGSITLFYFAAREMASGVMTIGSLLAYSLYLGNFFRPIEELADQYNVLQGAFASAEKIFDVLETKPEIVDAEDAIELETFTGHIEFKNVWFQYIPDEWVLKDVSFEVKPNETIAFVGATGSGKTTILSLIVRNYDIQAGEILIDGIDIRKIKISSLRRHVGQMLQDVFLFNATIRENITLFDDSISLDEVKKAAEYVGANEFIEKLPNQYEHMVLERGNNFSAGQRQLISFARALLYNPSLMILDEATANIDSETEVLIQESMVKLMNISTAIVVAHRLSTIQHSDRIIVMSAGEIVETGNHFELLKQKGHYHKLYEIQFESEGKHDKKRQNY